MNSNLLLASQTGDIDVVISALDMGANINIGAPNPHLWATPLYLASRNNHVNIVNLLVERGAHLNKTDFHGMTPLYIASHNGHVEVVRILADGGADIERCSYSMHTPLYTASYHGHVEVVALEVAVIGDLTISIYLF